MLIDVYKRYKSNNISGQTDSNNYSAFRAFVICGSGGLRCFADDVRYVQ